jgi:ABC-type nitrate/sulfonate/bicarbonate transport system substrate-binding protein
MNLRSRLWQALIALMILCPVSTSAESGELRVAKQFGLGYLQMMLMEEQKLVENHAKALGLGDIKVTWATFRSSDVMNDALLSGNVDFASVGAPGLAIIWAKTRGTPQEVRAAFGYNYFPTALSTRDPSIKTLKEVRNIREAIRHEHVRYGETGGEWCDRGMPLTVKVTRSTSKRASAGRRSFSDPWRHGISTHQ